MINQSFQPNNKLHFYPCLVGMKEKKKNCVEM